MIKLEVLMDLPYSRFDGLKSINRKDKEQKGYLFKGDIIEVETQEEADYLCGKNVKNLVACKVIVEIKEEKEKDIIVEQKPKKKRK